MDSDSGSDSVSSVEVFDIYERGDLDGSDDDIELMGSAQTLTSTQTTPGAQPYMFEPLEQEVNMSCEVIETSDPMPPPHDDRLENTNW